MILGILIIAVPVAVIGNKFAEVYSRYEEDAQIVKFRNVVLEDPKIDNDDPQKEIYVLLEMIKRVQEVNNKIEVGIYETIDEYNQTYRSLQNLIKTRVEKQKVQSNDQMKFRNVSTLIRTMA